MAVRFFGILRGIPGGLPLPSNYASKNSHEAT